VNVRRLPQARRPRCGRGHVRRELLNQGLLAGSGSVPLPWLWRDDVDFRDALRILQTLEEQSGVNCSSPEKLLQLVAAYFVPSQRMKASYALEELWELHEHLGADRG